jgi:hypothetical protein
MAEKKTTPVGIAHFPHLNEPDTKYNPEGVYHTKLRMDSSDPSVAKFIEWMDAQYDAAYEAAIQQVIDAGKYKTEAAARKRVKQADKPYVYVVDDETGDDTDEILVNFKLPASGKNKRTGKSWTMTPKIYLTQELLAQYPDELPSIWGGSKLSVSVSPNFWYTEKLGAGVKLRVEKFFVHELVTAGDDGDDSDVPEGFGRAASAKPAKSREPGEDDALGDDDDDDGTGDF